MLTSYSSARYCPMSLVGTVPTLSNAFTSRVQLEPRKLFTPFIREPRGSIQRYSEPWNTVDEPRASCVLTPTFPVTSPTPGMPRSGGMVEGIRNWISDRRARCLAELGNRLWGLRGWWERMDTHECFPSCYIPTPRLKHPLDYVLQTYKH